MTSFRFDDQATLPRFSAICWSLLGFYLLGTGIYDLLIDHASFELSRGTQILTTWEADKTRFLIAVSYRLVLGTVFTGVAFVCGRLHRPPPYGYRMTQASPSAQLKKSDKEE